ncbi:N-methyl-L-tryptophan oxidase [Microbacterium thalassium]|uniref:Monomeric sarcosine oxidase n=1 Tax=Microbacterium thalassium TaxID=362649 RepID=A0A7X0FQQ0_9MICO|nr:N-methyl-L-tryptophan oxidase [Microbacterium thalassium]MBB6391372.1 monomeric sarcosine oxidase [Microbacterium thalassium]GLK23330.1 N-methyltryptophan oxidase [Microbacterium thalassium]
MQHHDVIVIGLGSMGGAAANELAARGADVLGLETYEPGHEFGSAHGGSRIVRQSYFEDPQYVPLLRRAYDGWRRLEADSGRRIMTLCGGIYIGDPDELTFAGSLAAAREHGLAHEVLDAVEVRRRFPTIDPADDALAVYEADAGYVRPEETTIANAEVAARRGATLRFGERVRSWTATPGGGVQVTTDAGTYGADRLVIAPGAWAPELLPELALPLSIERMVFYWFTPEFSESLPYEAWSEARHPVYIEQTHGNGQIYGFPMTDGPEGGFKLGFFRKGSVTTADTIDRTVVDAEVEDMRERALQLFPQLTGPVVQAKTCLYSVTPDEHFVIGQHPEHPQVSIACGFSGHGFKFVPVVGEILADLATRGSTDLPIGLFDPLRAVLRA